MIASRWITACCIALGATTVVADDHYPPPTGPYSGQTGSEQNYTEWAPDPSQPSPFSHYSPSDGYGYQQNPAMDAPPPGYTDHPASSGHYPESPPTYGYYEGAAPPAQSDNRTSGFNPFNAMNNMFNSNNNTYRYRDMPPQQGQWGNPQAPSYSHGGGYPQYNANLPYGSAYPQAPGYGAVPQYGYPQQGYDYPQPAQRQINPYPPHNQPYRHGQEGTGYPQTTYQQPAYNESYGGTVPESFPPPQSYGSGYNSTPQGEYPQPINPGYPRNQPQSAHTPQPWKWAPRAAPVTDGNLTTTPQFAPVESKPATDGKARMMPQTEAPYHNPTVDTPNTPPPQFAPPPPVNGTYPQTPQPTANQAQAFPQASGLPNDAQTPVFRPLTEEESTTPTQETAPTNE